VTDWQTTLQQAGYPTCALVLDFECFFDTDYSLSRMSTVEYVCDSRFAVTGLAVRDVEQDQSHFIEPDNVQDYLHTLQESLGTNLQDCTIIGQNLKFDALVLREHFGIMPRFTIDTIDLDRIWDARASHKLKDMAARWAAPSPKGDTTQFKGKDWAVMSLQMRDDLAKYAKNDTDIECWLFKKLLPLVVNGCPEELAIATHTLQLYLEPYIEIDAGFGTKLKALMRCEPLHVIEKLYNMGIEAGHDDISGNISFAALLKGYLPDDEEVPTKQGKKGRILALAKDDEGMKYLLQHKDPKVRALVEARAAIKSWPLHIKRVDNILRQAAVRKNKIGAPLSYYSAHTGRWGGTEGINLQNLGGRGRAGKGTHPLIASVRQMLTAPKFHTFGIADFAQIEARVLAWFAGQDDLLTGFANGEDVYSTFATTLFRSPVRKPRDTDPTPVAKLLKVRRGFGKDGILGAGFGMGANKFFERCLANNDLRPAFDDGTFDWDFINTLIKTYRKQYKLIPAFWYKVEKAWRFVTRYKHETSEVNGLQFYHSDGATFVRLPSGRCLRYPCAAVNKTDSGLRYRWGKLWGGALTENIVQATARDLLRDAMLRLIEEGIHIVLHVHDEVVCLFLENEAEERLKQVEQLMVVVPEWASGLPVDVECELTPVYKK